MKRWDLATSINRWAFCVVVAAAGAAANAKTIELRDLDARGRDSFSDALVYGPSFADYADFGGDDRSPGGAFGISFDPSIYTFVVRGGATSATLQQLQTAVFRFAASARGPISFDELTTAGGHALVQSGIAGRFPGSPHRGTLQATAARETDLWVMLVVAVGVVLYQLRRKQRTLEQEPVAA